MASDPRKKQKLKSSATLEAAYAMTGLDEGDDVDVDEWHLQHVGR